MFGVNTTNIFYFPKNVDVRTCPKNGMTTLKHVWQNTFKHYMRSNNTLSFNIFDDYNELLRQDRDNTKKFRGEMTARDMLVIRHANMFDTPYRKGSFRIAVRRDPVERFKSAVEMLQVEYSDDLGKYSLQKNEIATKWPSYKERMDHFNHWELQIDLDALISKMEMNQLRNIHFYSQYWYMGSPSDYDVVYELSEMDDLITYLNKNSDMPSQIASKKIHTNVSLNTSEEKRAELASHANIMYSRNMATVQGIESVHVTANLSKVQIARIKNLYEMDYEHGWAK